MPAPIIESIAYLTHPDGTKIQVLKTVEVPQEDGTTLPMQEWDEQATAEAYRAYEASRVSSP